MRIGLRIFSKRSRPSNRSPRQSWRKPLGLPELGRFASKLGPGLRFTPATAGTDGFFVTGLRRR